MGEKFKNSEKDSEDSRKIQIFGDTMKGFQRRTGEKNLNIQIFGHVFKRIKKTRILVKKDESITELSRFGDIYVTVFLCISMSLSPIILDKITPLEEARPKLMIYPVEMFIDHDKYFTWIFIYGVVTGFITMTYTVACESMYAVNTQHACGLFAIVGHRYRNAIEEVEIIMNDKKQARAEALYEYITFSIERHNYAIEFVNTLEACYSPLLFSSMTFNMLETSITLLQTLLALGNMDKMIKYASFTLGVITHMFLVSLPGQRLVDHSTAVGQDLYNGSWYLLPLKIKKFYKMILMQARTPCTLTALGFYSVNFITFSSILKSSFSYFTLFSSFRK